MRLPRLALFLALSACSRPPAGPCRPEASARPDAAPVAAPTPHPPAGYVEMSASRVVETEQGKAVLLVTGDGRGILPIFIGDAEAMSIQLRLAHEKYQRPLTNDLLDSVVRELGARLVKIQVDDLRNGVFIGSVHLWRGEREVTIDARPSDAIALAVGNGVPIYVKQRVLDEGGIRPGPDDSAPDKSKGGSDDGDSI